MNNRNNQNLARRDNNYKGLKNLQRTLDNFFNDVWWPTNLTEVWESFQPQSKFSEYKDNYYIEVDLPGIKKEEVKIEVEENILRIHGERKEKNKQENTKQHYSEIFYGSFAREFVFPTSAEKEKIKAHYDNGMLFVTVPKSSKSKAHQVNIE
jgi:HSP20 family protein